MTVIDGVNGERQVRTTISHAAGRDNIVQMAVGIP